MKRILLFLFAVMSGLSAVSQGFPYGRMLNMIPEELAAERFDFDERRNQWVLRKAGNPDIKAGARPDSSDYTVLIQNGETGVASINVMFFDDNTYRELLTFAAGYGQNLIETDSGKIRTTQFDYDGFSFVVKSETIGVKAATRMPTAPARTKDKSYSVYDFTILTGTEPSSEYLRKESAKQLRRNGRARQKNCVDDPM